VRGLRHFGVRGVVAASFARIFMRSLVNLGIPTLECREIQPLVRDGEKVHLNFKEGWIELGGGKCISFSPLDLHVKKILEAGGLIPYLRGEKHGI
jgi:3-isopropylmalate/(R)-2-methylmalate dehydratase small subunit